MICKLRIVAGYKNKRTYFKDAFFTRPFRVADVGQYKTDMDLYLMVMSSSPGLLDGDHYDINVQMESEARLQLQSQAYQRLFNMQEGAAQKMVIRLERGSAFSYVPHPVVPHRNAKFKSHTTVHLQDNCELLLSEIITCGRKYSGEAFQFSYLQILTEVYHHQKMVLKDNLWLSPQQIQLHTIGQLEGYTHQGTLVYIFTGESTACVYMDDISRLLETENNMIFGISEIEANGFILRVLGNGGEQLFRCFQLVQEKLWLLQQAAVTIKPPELFTLQIPET